MPHRKPGFTLVMVGVLVLVVAALSLATTNPANAQCGSQASSCKNCHEVQGQDPVNNDGTGWHTGHAFGDFCYICHAGNNQSMDQDTAHTGMVPPMSDVNAACETCHPDDLMERSQVYATALGVEIGTGGSAPSGGSPASDPGSELAGGEPAAEAPASAPAEIVVPPSAEVIDYNQRYDQMVSGKTPVNWGNIILSILIAMTAFGGGAFVWFNERKLRNLPFLPVTEKPAVQDLEIPQIEGYSPEVLALLPQIAKLNPYGQQALKRLLENPDQASEMLHSLSRLDPDLVNRLRNLDRESRALLLALSGD